MSELTDLEKDILNCKFGLGGKKRENRTQMCSRFGSKKHWISRTTGKAIEKLRAAAREKYPNLFEKSMETV